MPLNKETKPESKAEIHGIGNDLSPWSFLFLNMIIKVSVV